jgi:hypothetical protein
MEPEAKVMYRAFVPGFDASDTCELIGPKKTSKPKEMNMVVLQPQCCDDQGKFLVTVTTKTGDDPKKSKFMVSAATSLTLFNVNGNQISSSFSSELETLDSGQLTFLILFAPAQTQVVFTLPSGKSSQHLFCKPPSAAQLEALKKSIRRK